MIYHSWGVTILCHRELILLFWPHRVTGPVQLPVKEPGLVTNLGGIRQYLEPLITLGHRRRFDSLVEGSVQNGIVVLLGLYLGILEG